MRLLSFVALIVAVALVPLAYAKARSDHDHHREVLARSLAAVADDQSAALDAALAQGRRTLRLTAHDPAFAEFSEASGTRIDRVRRSPFTDEVLRSLTFLSRLDPIDVSAASFIDRSGAENARVVHGLRVTRSSLARDVRGTRSFVLARRAPAGGVVISRPYISVSTQTWVLGVATPIRRDGRFLGVVQYELSLESLRGILQAAPAGVVVHVADARTGRVVLDGAHPLVRTGTLTDGKGEASIARQLRSLTGQRAAGSIDGRPDALRRVSADPLDANTWVVVATAARRPPSLLADAGATPFVLVIASLILGLSALLGLRMSGRALRDAALTDVLTGLPNRRAFMEDVERSLNRTSAPARLFLMDLDGFKGYNDAFGHPAGDDLLARLGAALAASVRGEGRAYRLGGDEFCVVAEAGPRTDTLEDRLVAALSEHGDGFTVTPSVGACALPAEAQDAAEALRIADTRMYARKHSRRPLQDGSRDVLLSALVERDPDLAEHTGDVARLADAVAGELDLDLVVREHVRLAADLHDIGKVAIPDAILRKPGPLSDAEWAFMRRHTVIGERILRASPALEPVADLVRASHERWDGRGYPDGTAGSDIPLGARIVAVCDAYDAMVSDRAYRAGRPPAEALDELRRCAGTQFDPAVIAAFGRVLAGREVAVV